ncbi:MAG: right-handed parallel beta-helix repeat-containing protein, partial [Bacteroidota bacterium]
MKNGYLWSLFLVLTLFACTDNTSSNSDPSAQAEVNTNVSVSEPVVETATVSSTEAEERSLPTKRKDDTEDALVEETAPVMEELRMATPEEVADLYRQIESKNEVQLQNLIYLLDRTIDIYNRRGFTLNGGGATLLMEYESEDVVLVHGSTDVTLTNFQATHIEPDGPLGCTGNVIQVYNCSNVVVSGCQLNGSGIIGVVAYETKYLHVKDSYIYNNSEYGVLLDQNSTVRLT